MFAVSSLDAAFGGDHDDAVGSVGAVDGRGGGILEDFDGLDVIRVEEGQRIESTVTRRRGSGDFTAAEVHLHAVDDNQG